MRPTQVVATAADHSCTGSYVIKEISACTIVVRVRVAVYACGGFIPAFCLDRNQYNTSAGTLYQYVQGQLTGQLPILATSGPNSSWRLKCVTRVKTGDAMAPATAPTTTVISDNETFIFLTNRLCLF